MLVPLIPTTLSLQTFDQLIRFVADSGGSRPEVLAFFSMAEQPGCGLLRTALGGGAPRCAQPQPAAARPSGNRSVQT